MPVLITDRESSLRKTTTTKTDLHVFKSILRLTTTENNALRRYEEDWRKAVTSEKL